ncbi:sigma-54 interaction domain-containing protein [Heyndrickxia acidicola]|uniref:HTH-type transcriptional regulatory protein TyrR n=1 Tax=Heyndrickxia acidicola TaxID=209389 RepID=A0ABU6MB68_9BACI|nr:sigma 54-interacting transcriptional regulator [Heyndrickxia acidicola]MED1201669.1 sigma 54-interacting transcriptional regulator [Heyndrickxia acidicola]
MKALLVLVLVFTYGSVSLVNKWGEELIDGIADVPFTIIITDQKNMIIWMGIHQKEQGGVFHTLNIGDSLEGAFDRWSSKRKNMVCASKGSEKYILLWKKCFYNEEQAKAYMFGPGEEYFELEARVKELDTANHELDAIIESSYDGIYITDKYGNTLKTNSAIERITGIPKHYYLGKNIAHLIKRGILQESVTQHVIEQKRTVSLVQKNYNNKETLMTGSPIFDEKGEIDKIVTNIRDLTELNQLNEELQKAMLLNKEYEKEISRLKSISSLEPDIIIESEKMRDLYQMTQRMARFDTSILILGETGVGKDILARYIYRTSSRFEKGQFVKINCGAIPKELIESELFGYEGGAFSGANRTGKAGLFELAHKGILFLDEIGELPLSVQVKLLRAVQDKEILRVGGTKTKKVDVRIVSATNRNLKEMVRKGEFREDLYYRLSVVPVCIPPLRERKDDILPLVYFLLNAYNQKYYLSKKLDQKLHDFLLHYEWPGNVRELSNLMERMLLTVPKDILGMDDLPDDYKSFCKLADEPSLDLSLKEIAEQAEKKALEKALVHYGTTYEIARKLKTSQATIVRKLQKYKLTE